MINMFDLKCSLLVLIVKKKRKTEVIYILNNYNLHKYNVLTMNAVIIIMK